MCNDKRTYCSFAISTLNVCLVYMVHALQSTSNVHAYIQEANSKLRRQLRSAKEKKAHRLQTASHRCWGQSPLSPMLSNSSIVLPSLRALALLW
jgi:hypothetical protein